MIGLAAGVETNGGGCELDTVVGAACRGERGCANGPVLGWRVGLCGALERAVKLGKTTLMYAAACYVNAYALSAAACAWPEACSFGGQDRANKDGHLLEYY